MPLAAFTMLLSMSPTKALLILSGVDHSNLPLCGLFVFCRGELGGESQRPSVEESTRAENKTQLAQFQENPSKLQTSQERQPVSHCEEGPSQSQTSASLRKQCSVQPGAALSGCSGHKSGETSQGELVLVLAPKQVQASLIHSSSLLLRDGPLGSELTDHRTAGGESSHWSEPDEARLNPLSMPSGDFLPTFTNQRPPYVASRNTSSSTTTKQRYRKFQTDIFQHTHSSKCLSVAQLMNHLHVGSQNSLLLVVGSVVSFAT